MPDSITYMTAFSKVYECKAKGVFRNRKIKPLVGDNVEFDVLSEEQSLGNIVEILPRENSLIRPAVANIDQAMIVFAVADPEPNLTFWTAFWLRWKPECSGGDLL